jgi:hypothetical protein
MNNKNVRVVGAGLTGLVPLIVAVQSDMTNHYFAKSPIGSAAIFELIVGGIFDSSKLAHVLRRVERCEFSDALLFLKRANSYSQLNKLRIVLLVLRIARCFSDCGVRTRGNWVTAKRSLLAG